VIGVRRGAGGISIQAIGLIALSLAGAHPAVASLEEAEQALRTGSYDDALSAFEAESVRTPTPRLYKGWVEALRLTGRSSEALDTIEGFLEREPASVELENTRGELLFETGRIDEARSAFERAIAGHASDALTAELNLAIVLHDEGEVEEALRRFDRFIDVYNQNAKLDSEALIAVGIACRYLGVTNSNLFKDALKAFDEAQAAAPDAHEPAILAGQLFLEKYNSTDAAESFQKVLAVNPNHPEALLGMARVREFDGSSEAMVLTEKALQVRPDYVEARAFLAEQFLGLEDYDRAREEAERALDINPVSPEALPILAAAEFLSGNAEGFRAVESRALARNPRHADFYNKLSEIAVNNRLYAEASDFAKKAIALDERSWWGHGLYGLNELRLGHIEEGRKSLERSFEGDPYNVWVKNTLDLLDTYPDYVTTKTDKFEIFVQNKEAALLTGYVEQIASEAYEKLSERYQFRPQTPIRIEVYPSHGDFSVGQAQGTVQLGIDLVARARPYGDARSHRSQSAALVLRRAVGSGGAARATRVGRRCQHRFSGRLRAGQALAGRGAQQRIHAAHPSPADRYLLLSGVPRLRVDRAGLRLPGDTGHALAIP
jgi:tetratricopeptide (TPR) repeat protein